MKQEPLVELLAPAGNKEGFYGAIQAGADAVYLGGNRFSARAYADNFSTEELTECIRYAHLWKRKVYLTLNTLIKEDEFAEIYDYIKPFYEAGLDGVIVQDMGVFVLLRRNFPELKLHASTQMTLTGVSGAALLKRMGACRIVPARELSLEEICTIKKETGLEVETFIHGAMCYSYSGQCLFSSMLGERSGNRGRCAQPCRLPYRIDTSDTRTKECYPLSLKDMCTIEHIPQFIEAGIDSFKIEGRMKKPEYVAGVTAIYRKYIDLYCRLVKEGKNPLKEWKIDKKDLHILKNLYIRNDTQDGYYFRHNGREMVTYDTSAYGAAEEGLLAQIHDKYLTKRPSISVWMKASFLIGSPAQLTVSVKEDGAGEPQIEEEAIALQVTVSGDEVQKAAKQPITIQNIEKQLGKLGDSIFTAIQIEIQADADAFYPLGAINELRRQAVRKLEDLLIVTNALPVWRKTGETLYENIKEENQTSVSKKKNQRFQGFVLSLRTMEQMSAVTGFVEKAALAQENFEIRRIYIEGDMLFAKPQETLKFCRYIKNSMEDVKIAISLPYIIRKRDDDYMEKLFALIGQNKGILDGVQIRSLDGIGLWEKMSGKIYADAGFYIWNRETINVWKPFLSGFCMPYELTGREQMKLLEDNTLSCEKVIYGRIPMMLTANCVAKTAQQCSLDSRRLYHKNRIVRLTDRYRKNFPVELNCLHCMNIIYNSVPLSLHGELAKWKDKAFLRLNFTLEDKDETVEILNFFEAVKREGFAKDVRKLPFPEYTTGHEKHMTE